MLINQEGKAVNSQSRGQNSWSNNVLIIPHKLTLDIMLIQDSPFGDIAWISKYSVYIKMNAQSKCKYKNIILTFYI